MRLHLLLFAFSLALVAQEAKPAGVAPPTIPVINPAPVPPPAPVTADPMEPPPELTEFARKVTLIGHGNTQKTQALLTAFFRSPEADGLGLTYDNSRTRTLKEIWRDRKANCLGLTGLLGAACKIIDVPFNYAEPTNTVQWRRTGRLIRYERHVVALVRVPPLDDVVADFLPRLQRRESRYIVNLITEARMRALWAANRAAECLEVQDYTQAEAFALKSIQADPSCSTGWNTLGVMKGLQSDSDTAERCYRKAIQVDPAEGTAVGNLEALLLRNGRWEESIAYRRLGHELRRRDPYFHAFLASEFLESGRPEEALKSIRMAIKIQPHDSDLHLQEAQIRLVQGRNDEAAKCLELAHRWASPREKERYGSKLAALRQMQG